MDVREKLIVEVKRNPALYDKTNEDYKNYELRVQIWTAIGRKIGLSASEAQAKWKNLRDNMVKRMKRNVVNKDGQRKVKLYRFAKMLDFIVPFLELNSRSNNEAADNTNGLTLDCEDVTGDSYTADGPTSPAEDPTPEEDNTFPGVFTVQGQSQPSSPSSSISYHVCSPPPKRRRCSVPIKVDSAVLDPPRQRTETMEQDDIGLFLSSMAGSIRKLPPDVQARVRFSIHKVVHDAEMEYLYPSTRLKEDKN